MRRRLKRLLLVEQRLAKRIDAPRLARRNIGVVQGAFLCAAQQKVPGEIGGLGFANVRFQHFA